MHTLANSEDTYEMPQNAAIHQSTVAKKTLEKAIQFFI